MLDHRSSLLSLLIDDGGRMLWDLIIEAWNTWRKR